MAKITALPAAASVSGDDLLALVNDPAGTPVTQKATVTSVLALVPDPVWGDLTGTLSNQTDLQSALNGKAGTAHTHVIDDVASLQTTLDGKSATGHTHAGVYEPADAAIQSHITSAHAPSNAQKNSDITKAEIEAKLTGEISSHTHAGGSQAFPVGSVFIAVVSTNPATLLGYGTWSAFAAGRMLVGLDAGQTEFDTVRETGGVKTHTLTVTEMPAHTHVVTSQTATTGSATSYEHGVLDTSSAEAEATEVTGSTGGGAAHQNLPPFIVVYIWERTA